MHLSKKSDIIKKKKLKLTQNLYKVFKECLKNKDSTKAKETALLLIESEYPYILKKDAINYLKTENLYTSKASLNSPNKKLYEFVIEIPESDEDSTLSFKTWFPWRIYKLIQRNNNDFFDKEFCFKEYNEKFLKEGVNTLGILKNISENLVKEEIENFFDYDFYRSYEDLKDWKDEDLLTHYVIRGIEEPQRNPNLIFDNKLFIQLYPWVKEIKLNPLFIFLLWPEEFKEMVIEIKKNYNILKSETSLDPNKKWAMKNIEHQKNKDIFDYQRILYLLEEITSTNRRIKPNFKSLNLHIVIPDFQKGSGGHMTIFRMIKHLEDLGHNFFIWIKDYNKDNHLYGPHQTITTHFQKIKAKVSELNTHFAFVHGDGLIASSWDTVDIVMKHKSFIEKFYFVQDYEPFFFPKGSNFISAEETYKKDIRTICASPWLDRLMRENFNKESCFFNLSYNNEIYFPRKKNLHSQNLTQKPFIRIAFYARIFTYRRAVELALQGLKELAKSDNKICLELFGVEKGTISIPTNLQGIDNGVLSPDELSDLYSKCDLGITFSCTNYALVPQEMMACKLPVVEIDIESNREIYPEGVVQFVKPTPEGIAEGLQELIKDERKRVSIIQNAYEWVNSSSWEDSFKTVNNFILSSIKKTIQGKKIYKSIPERYLSSEFKTLKNLKRDDYLATVVIPTYNGGDSLVDCVRTLIDQETDFNYEILIIDSSSSDDSIPKLPEDDNLSIYKISKEQFQHGRTRNLAISLSKGEYIAFLTQDALPINNNWLSNIVNPLQIDEEISAVFGKHIGHKSHPNYIKEEIDEFFKQFDSKQNFKKKNNLLKYYSKDITYRQNLHYYSDNNSCLRKSEWMNFPYHDVDYGEDQLWADWIIQTNKIKYYASNAVVSHSHDYNETEEYLRSFTEAYFFLKYFGYDLSQNRLYSEITVANFAKNLIKENKLNLNLIESDIRLLKIRSKIEGYNKGVKKFKKEAFKS